MARLGVSLHTDEILNVKAAFIADWQHGRATSLRGWIEQALTTHLKRTSQQRRDLARTPRTEGRAQPQSYDVDPELIAQVKTAVAHDSNIGFLTNQSRWTGDAITAAVNQARVNAGGTLPEPPERIPTRLPPRTEPS